MTMQERPNMKTRTQTKMDVLPDFLAYQSARRRPPMVPNIDQSDTQNPYHTNS